jgi:hypothetical protein
MKKKTYSLVVLFIFLLCNILKAQVGIGTTTPSAQLTLETGKTNIAPLGLGNLDEAPSINLVGGQISVIDNELYLYNDLHEKWLSVATMPITFSREGDITTQNLLHGGNVSNEKSQATMPFDGTIVHISAKAESSSGTGAKRFQVRVYRNNTNVPGNFIFNLGTNDKFVKTNYTNRDFLAGDNIHVRSRVGSSIVTDPSVIVWVKWRK